MLVASKDITLKGKIQGERWPLGTTGSYPRPLLL
jgi:hypothetical protein